MEKIQPKIEESWKLALKAEFKTEYFSELKRFLENERNTGQIIYPQGQNIFAAFDKTPIEKVKVVILQSVSDCIIIKSKNIMMNNTLFHHIGFDIVNNILQYHGKETYVDARNNRYVRFTKEYISKHPLNQLQRIRAYKSIQTFIKMFTAELQTVDMQKIELTRPYRRYIVGFVNRITYIDKRFYNYKGRFCYEGGRRVIIMKDFHSRCKYNIYASYLYINEKS